MTRFNEPECNEETQATFFFNARWEFINPLYSNRSTSQRIKALHMKSQANLNGCGSSGNIAKRNTADYQKFDAAAQSSRRYVSLERIVAFLRTTVYSSSS